WVASSGLTELSGGVSIMNKLDSPATTSSVTYKVQWATRTNGNTVSAILNDGGSDANKAVITLMEVAA
ncbi:hypothetical protein EBT31_17885, partial [bacterium]|nr:hypothetical protein [bacterium]